MLTLRPAEERGHTDLGWLDSRHTFSFGGYFDPRQMGFGTLRVINDDRVIGGGGFGTHPHRDMEIISVVIDGGLAHRDSMGNGDVLRPGDVQVMSAGTGLTHSEYNASETDPVHFLQIWIEPAQTGRPPRYEQRTFETAGRDGRLQLVASGGGEAGALAIGQDARLYRVDLREGQQVEHRLSKGRRGWVQVATGEAEIDGMRLRAGDGVAVRDESVLRLEGVTTEPSQLLVFDLA